MGEVLLIVGGQWGDEGKGKYTDLLAQNGVIGLVARGNGGANAGHNIHIPELGIDFDTHQLPSGIFNEDAMNLIGQGCVTDPVGLLDEMQRYTEKTKGRELTPDRLMLSARAHIITPGHRILDGIRDAKAKVGTTNRGIGPGYTDKAARIGIRAIDLLNNPQDVNELLSFQRREIRRLAPKDDKKGKVELFDSMVVDFREAVDAIKPYVIDPLPFVRDILRSDKKIIAEGAQGILLGINGGTYPYVTSSDTSAGGLISGIDGLPTAPIKSVLGIFKLPMTRVGSGPFVTRFGAEESELGKRLGGIKGEPGSEFGATTGRERDKGWFDAVAGRYAVEMGGITEVALTKLDMLDGIDVLKVCVAYEIDGQEVTEMPADTKLLERAKPIYKEYKGWIQSTVGITNFNELPTEAKTYIKDLRKRMNIKVTYVGTGTGRNDLIKL